MEYASGPAVPDQRANHIHHHQHPHAAGAPHAHVTAPRKASAGGDGHDKPPRQKHSRRKTAVDAADDDPSKRRCVSSACVACRKRKSKCDGNTPACAACAQVYGTECVYDLNSDHRRKGVYRSGSGAGDDGSETRESTLQALVQALLNLDEGEAVELLREMRVAESLDAIAEKVLERGDVPALQTEASDGVGKDEVDGGGLALDKQLYGKMGDLRLEEGSVRYIGGTSNMIHITQDVDGEEADQYLQQEDPITSWTTVTDDPELVVHLLNMYFAYHYTYFTTLSKTLFYRDFMLGRPPSNARRKTYYCSPLLVNAMLALGCHFTSYRGARADPDDSATAGDHFFKEAKRLILENDEHERPRLTTVQALALMSVREAGCGREAKGWVYSGMSFRMALDMGLNLDTGRLTTNKHVNGNEAEEDVRRITFWGCYLFDKCWSNYLGRLPQIPTSIITVPKPEVFPDEDAASWSPYSDSGPVHAHAQPARTRAVALQITKLCEISNDLMEYFYNPTSIEKGRSKTAELKMLSEIHRRLETWRCDLPKEFEPREGGLSSVLTMHMFFQLLYIHLFRPFLRYTKETSPLPDNVSPRKLCTAAAAMISKLMRLYKRSHGLRQICNIAVYVLHSACTIHLLNLPDKGARRDVVHGVKHLEDMAEGWLCARRSLGMVSVLARKWRVELPDEAAAVLARTDRKFGPYDAPSPSSSGVASPRHDVPTPSRFAMPQQPPAPQPSAAFPMAGAADGRGFSAHSSPLSATFPADPSSAFAPAAFPPAPHNDNNNNSHHNNSAFAPPSYDPNGLHAQRFPSAQHFASAGGSAPPPPPPPSFPPASSPGAMFGGVEQLLQDSSAAASDWTWREPAAIATGFENWSALDVSPGVWRHGGGMGFAGMQAGFPSAAGVEQQFAGLSGNAGFAAAVAAGGGYEEEEEWYR